MIVLVFALFACAGMLAVVCGAFFGQLRQLLATQAERDDFHAKFNESTITIENLLLERQEYVSENARLVAQLQSNVMHQDGCHGCGGDFECQQCNRRVGNCLGCADEHYALCDECAGKEVTK